MKCVCAVSVLNAVDFGYLVFGGKKMYNIHRIRKLGLTLFTLSLSEGLSLCTFISEPITAVSHQ